MGEFRVIFAAADYEAAVGFFADVMGLEVERSFGEIFKGTILLAASGRIEVIEAGSGWDEPGVSGVTVSWQIDDAEAEHARLAAAGAVVVRPPELQPWGHKSLELAGPEGLRIILFEVLSPQ